MHLPTLTLSASAPLLLAAVASAAPGNGEAVYRVRFDATWSSQTHPDAYPPGAHFSGLVGGTHSGAVSFWEPGGLASPGIESMAETGGQFLLAGEVQTAIEMGTALQTILGGGIGSPGNVATTFSVTDEFPLVTVVSMIAPSPDWFVGVHGMSLMENGAWRDDVVVELFAYDSGTDSGQDFLSPNQDTNPQEPIHLITQGPFLGTTPLGTFTFTRLASTLEYGCDAAAAGSLSVVDGEPTLGNTLRLALTDPTGTTSAPATTLLALSPTADPAFPCGSPVPGWGLGGGAGELLIGNVVGLRAGAPWMGSPVSFPVAIPSDASLIGVTVYTQGVLIGADSGIGLTSGIEVRIGA